MGGSDADPAYGIDCFVFFYKSGEQHHLLFPDFGALQKVLYRPGLFDHSLEIPLDRSKNDDNLSAFGLSGGIFYCPQQRTASEYSGALHYHSHVDQHAGTYLGMDWALE